MNNDWDTLVEFDLPSEPGNERQAMAQVAEAVKELSLPKERLDRLGTAVGEAAMNAMEHGNGYRPDLPVSILCPGLEDGARGAHHRPRRGQANTGGGDARPGG